MKLLPSRLSLRRWFFEALFVIAILVLIQAWQQRDAPSGQAPAIVGNLADGQPFDLNAWHQQNYPGRPVALHFWASWCPICSAEEGSISAVAKDNAVMTVAMQSGSAGQISSQLKKKSLAWPTLVDADGRMAATYGLKGVPAFVVIGPDGRVRSISMGYTSEMGMRVRLWWVEHF